MKKIFFCLLFLAGQYTLIAQKVCIDTLEIVAKNLLLSKTSANIEVDKIVNYQNDSLIYIFVFKDKGFVILSAIYDAEPVLGYSPENKIDLNNPPPAFLNFMEAYKKQINFIKTKKIKNPDYRSKWNEYKNERTSLKKSYSPDDILLQIDQSNIQSEVMWGQSWNNNGGCYPAYNIYGASDGDCTEDCDRKPLGCGAVAMGQIMWYWQWPPKSTYNSYDWDLMPTNLLESSVNNKYAEAIGSLLKDCGRASDMDYNCWGSWTTIGEIEDAFNDYFGYYAHSHDRTWYSDAVWLNMIKDDINSGWPVLCRNGGLDLWDNHIFVFDGYNTDNEIHVNWGWHGSNNGFFPINNMVVDGENYSNNQVMLHNIHPNCSYIPTQIIDVSYTSVTSGTFSQEQARSDVILPATGKELNIEQVGKVLFVSPNSITLKPGFWAKSGSEFQTIFRTCGVPRSTISNVGDVWLKKSSDETDDCISSVVSNLNSGTFINVFPNPTSDFVHIENLPVNIEEVIIYTFNGTLLQSTKIKGETKVLLDFTKMPHGLYYIKIISSNRMITQKIIKL
jgi:hypothetical protein